MSSPVVGSARLVINPTYGDIRGPLKKEFDKGSQQFKQHGRDAGSGFTSGFGSKVKDTERVSEESGRRGGMRFVSGFTSRIGPRAFSASTGVFQSSMTGLAGAATTGAVALAGLGSAGIAAGVAIGVKTAASLEQSQVAFTTLLHSSTQAKSFLGDLSKFAAATPFTMPGLVDASRQLLGVGQSASSVIPTLTAWGDTAGALGLTQDQFSRSMLAVTQSMANGKIQAGDMLQITQAGIPIWAILSRALGKPVAEVRKLSEGGKLLTADVLPKLQAQMEKDYGGSMAKQSKTLTGIWSTFTDTLSMGLATAVQPMIPALKTGLTGAIGVVGGALRTLPAAGRAITPVFKEARGGVMAFIAAFKAGDGDITSSGFAGKMEMIGLKTRTAFDVARSAVRAGVTEFQHILPTIISVGTTVEHGLMPSFRNLGSFLVGSVIPSVRNLAIFFGSTLLPAIRPVAIVVGVTLLVAFRVLSILLANVVGPAIRGITGFLKDHRVIVTSVVIVIGSMVAITKAYQLVVTGVMIVQRLFTAGMLIARGAIVSMRVAVFLLNTAFAANPIGVVIVLVAALAAGLIYAYKHSETFRHIVTVAWIEIQNVAHSAWYGFLQPIFTKFSSSINGVQHAWSVAGTVFSQIWGKVQNSFRTGVTFILGYFDQVLQGFQHLLNAAGRLPGPLGAPFRKASDAIQGARNKIHDLQAGINATHGKNVNVGVTIKGNYVVVAGAGTSGTGGTRIRFDRGGFVEGPWMGARADNVLARVNPKEFVVQAPAAMALERRRPGFLQSFVNRFHELDIGGDPSGAWVGRSGKSGIPSRAYGGFVNYAGRFAGGGSIPAIQSFLRGVDPLPYIWGAVGPGGYDCSGLVGEVYNRLLGLKSYVRRFTTANESGFFKPGKGTFTVGINPGQHTAGNLAGFAFEAASTASGIHTGAAAQPVTRFQRVMYLPEVGGTFVPGGGGVAAAPTIGINTLRQIVSSMAPSLVAGVARSIGFHTYDTGGGKRWPSGTAGFNFSGEDEFVFKGSQLATTSSGGVVFQRGTIQINVAGSLDEKAVPHLQAALHDTLYDMLREVRTGPRR